MFTDYYIKTIISQMLPLQWVHDRKHILSPTGEEDDGMDRPAIHVNLIVRGEEGYDLNKLFILTRIES